MTRRGGKELSRLPSLVLSHYLTVPWGSLTRYLTHYMDPLLARRALGRLRVCLSVSG